MPLQKQTLAVSLAQGMNTKVDPKQLKNDYTYVQNAIYQTLGELNLRSGFQALTTSIYGGGNISAGNRLSTVNSVALVHDGANAYSRSGDLSDWVLVGPKPALSTSLQTIGSGSYQSVTSVGRALASNGLELYVWIGEKPASATSFGMGTPRYAVFDTINNITLQSGIIPTTANTFTASVRCEVIGSNFYIVTFVSTSASANPTRIDYLKQSTATPNFASATINTIDHAVGTTNIFVDTCVGPAALYVLCGKVYRVDDSSGTVTSTAGTNYGQQLFAGINYDAAANRVWVANNDGSQSQAAILDSNLGVVQALTTFDSNVITASFSALSLSVASNVAYVTMSTNTALQEAFYSLTFTGSGFTVLKSTLFGSSQFCSKPLIDGSNITYVGIYTDSHQNTSVSPPVQPTTFLLQFPISSIGQSRIVPKLLARAEGLSTGAAYSVVGDTSFVPFLLCLPPANLLLAASTYSFPNTLTTDINSNTGFPYEVLSKNMWGTGAKLRGGSLAGEIHTTGGYLSVYDTSIESEHGFELFPEIIAQTAVASVLPIPAGTYEAQVVLRWEDAVGQTHQSAPSPGVTITADGSHNYQLQVIVPTLSTKPEIYLDLYLTGTNGTELTLNQSLLYFPSTTSGYLTITTNATMNGLPIYVTGGVVENIVAPPSSYAALFKNRLFLIPSETPYTLWYSKQNVPGTPVQFSDLFTMNLETRGGPATALAAMDDKLVIFKQTQIFYIVGDGPDNTGANNDFSYPQIVPSDSGCTEPDSVISFPGGVLYKGAKGIYLLDRALTIDYIGAPVEAYNQFTITSSSLDYNLNLIRYTLSNGTSLVYDYYVKKWSVFTNISAVSTAIINNVYSYLTASGTVNQETPGSYSDNGSVISMQFTTSWLSFGDVQGFQRFWQMLLLGEVFSSHTLTAGFAYDFDPTVVNTAILSSTAAEPGWERRVFSKRQQCTAVQITFTVTPADTSGKALTLSNANLEVGVEPNSNRIRAARSYGAK